MVIVLTIVVISVCLILVISAVLPVADINDAVSPRTLADNDSCFIETDAGCIHYKTTGAGSRGVVLLHGYCANTNTWRSVIDGFIEFGRVMAYDRTGFGLSSRLVQGDWAVGEGSPYSLAAQTDLLLELITRMSFEKTILVGHSAGGAVAMSAVIKRPDLFDGLVLVSPALGGTGVGPVWMTMFAKLRLTENLALLLARYLMKENRFVIRESWHESEAIPQAVYDAYRLNTRVKSWDRAVMEHMKAQKPALLEESLGELRVPALMVTGDDDRIVPTAQSERISRGIYGVKTVVIPECGHSPQEERPTEFLDAVCPFIREIINA